jgi:hypothetical protein
VSKIPNTTNSLLRRFTSSERGTHLVELAIVLPILMIFFAATAEFGRYFYTYTTLAKATRSGARYLATSSIRDKATEDTRVRNLVMCGDPLAVCDDSSKVINGLESSHIEIRREIDGAATSALPETVTVEIDGYVYQPLFNLAALAGDTVSLNIEVRPSTTMRYLLTQPPL